MLLGDEAEGTFDDCVAVVEKVWTFSGTGDMQIVFW